MDSFDSLNGQEQMMALINASTSITQVTNGKAEPTISLERNGRKLDIVPHRMVSTESVKVKYGARAMPKQAAARPAKRTRLSNAAPSPPPQVDDDDWESDDSDDDDDNDDEDPWEVIKANVSLVLTSVRSRADASRLRSSTR
jgi:hypothetical protein